MITSSRRHYTEPPTHRLARDPLEYAPSSTTTINTDRLNLNDPNYENLQLEYRPAFIFTNEWNYLDAAPLRCVVIPALALYLGPLVLAAYRAGAFFASLVVLAPLVVYAVSLTPGKRFTRSLLAALALSLMTFFVYELARAAATMAQASPKSIDRESIDLLFGCAPPLLFTVVAFGYARLSFRHFHAHPSVAPFWRTVIAHGLTRDPAIIRDSAKRSRIEKWLWNPEVTQWLGVTLWLLTYLYTVGMVAAGGAFVREFQGAAPYGGGLLLLTLWMMPAAVAAVTWFRPLAIGPLIRETRSPAPGIWRGGSKMTASRRRFYALLAVIALQLAIGWAARWGDTSVDPARPMFADVVPEPTITAPAADERVSPKARAVLLRVVVLTCVSSVSVLACVAPFVLAFLLYGKIERAYQRAQHGAPFAAPLTYAHRLHSSPVTLKGVDGEEIREADHIYIGHEPHQHFPILLHRPLLHEHCYIVGDSGSGKTSLGLMPLIANLIGFQYEGREKAAVIVLDLKGDKALFGCTKTAAKWAGRSFRYFTPEPGRSSFVFNPFNDIDDTGRRTPIQIAELLLDALSLNHGEGYGRSYYSRRNRDFLLDALAQQPRPSTFEELYAALDRLARMDQARYRDAYELLATMRALTFYPQLNAKGGDVDAARTIHMPSVLEHGQIVYFWLPSATESVSVREIGKLAVYALLTAAVAQPPDRRRRVYLVIDEFQRLAAENFKVVLEQARSFGIGVILANQSIAELETTSGDLRSVVRSNTRVKMHFSVQNSSDLKELSEMSGLDVVTHHTRAISTPIGWAGSGQETLTTLQTTKPRLTTSDILAISDHPRRFVLHITRGSGLTQYGGRALPVQADYLVHRFTYDAWASAEWPVDPQLAVSEKSPAKVDTEARHEVIERQRQIIDETFDELTRGDSFEFPE